MDLQCRLHTLFNIKKQPSSPRLTMLNAAALLVDYNLHKDCSSRLLMQAPPPPSSIPAGIQSEGVPRHLPATFGSLLVSWLCHARREGSPVRHRSGSGIPVVRHATDSGFSSNKRVSSNWFIACTGL